MAHRKLLAALGMIALAAPVAATRPEPMRPAGAPTASETALYCLHIEITGSRIEKVLCLTREEWAEQDVDLDKEWAENGVRVIA